MRKAALFSILTAGALAVTAIAPTQQAIASDDSDRADFWWGNWTWWRPGPVDDRTQEEIEADLAAERARRRLDRKTLKGTKCWKFKAVFGKDAFMELHFFNKRHGHSLVSGRVIRADGVNKKPDRVLQVSGSASFHEFVGDNKTKIERYLLNLTYSMSKTGTDPAKAFTEASSHLRGHYNVRLNPKGMSGVFAGNDFILDWATPLTGPVGNPENNNKPVTYRADFDVQGGNGVTANYMGGLDCTGNSCGTILPINNTGTLELVGNSKRECDNARETFGPDFVSGKPAKPAKPAYE